jgi:DNA-directed RNA polymerase subunit M/transcription elongation factor TFIIS
MPPRTFYNPVSAPADVRAKSTEMLKEIVGDSDIARLLERATWNHAVMFCKKKEQPLNWDNSAFRYAYTQKVLGVRYIARERPEVLQKYMELDPTLKAFVNAKPHELWPEKWAQAFEDAARKALRFTDASAMDPEQMPDGILKCRCGSMKTSYYELQCRSADEPKRHGLKSIAPRTSGPCVWKNRLDFQTLMMVYVSC